MTKLIYLASISLACAALPVFSTGCTCKNAIPVMVVSQNVIIEAEVAVEQAQNIANVLTNIDDATKQKLNSAITQALAGLQNAAIGIQQAEQSCSNPNYTELFKEFNAAWDIIRAVIPTVISVLSAKNEHFTAIKDPVAYSFR